MTWQRHRTPASYSSSTLSSTSSGTSSTGTYASIKSVSSCASRLSSQLQPSNFWNKFDRKTKTYSVLSVLKNIFKHKERGEPSKLSKENLQIYHITPLHSETSFILAPPRVSAPPSSLSSCPAGLYCVIEDFLTEYDLRLEEEEERAEMIARKTKELKPLTVSP